MTQQAADHIDAAATNSVGGIMLKASSPEGGRDVAPTSRQSRRSRQLRIGIIAAASLAGSIIGVLLSNPSLILGNPPPQDIYKAKLRQDIQSLDRGLLAYSPISKLKTGASTEFDVVITDIGRGPQLNIVTRVDGLVVYQQDVPTGGIVGVQAVECQNLTCIPESSPGQPVLFRGNSAKWVWQITAGTPGPAKIVLRADTYDQGTRQTLREEIIPITGMIVPTPAYNRRHSPPKTGHPPRSGVNLIVIVGLIAFAIFAGGISWFVMKRRQRMPGVGRRIKLWLRVLRAGVKGLDTVAGWIGVAVLLLGLAGVAVTLVLHVPVPLTVIIFMGLLLVVVLEGAYQIWDKTDQGRQSAEAARDAAQQELEAQRRAHVQELAERKLTATEVP